MDTVCDARLYPSADAYLRSCPSRQVLELLGNKWTVLIMPTLADGPLRFGELRRRLDGITQKSLTQALRGLERDGLVTRRIYPTIPPRVDYALTDLGRQAGRLLDALRLFAQTHMPDILAARAAYDARTAVEPAAAPLGHQATGEQA